MREIDAKEFDKEVLQTKGLVLVDFNADWCGPCQMMRAVLEEFAEGNPAVKVVGVNVDDNEDLAREYAVSGIPCMILFSDGKETKRVVGVQSVKKLEKMVGV